jgi:hypothetical protein
LAQRQWLDDIKLARGCADCGYDAHPAALDFDHLPGTATLASIAFLRVTRYPRSVIQEELAKCEVVCANCHRIRTVERRRSLRH